ncbi:hypothetical protein LA080_007193 [Diaporthe eres]|nr:hypothetical protein LA080_007193 [Diaporthe eres]
MATHSEDIELLVDVVKNRQKFPRPCVRAFDRLSNAASDTTERIFFDTGGVSAWATYVLTKKASEGTGHVPGRSKRRQLLARIEASPIDARKELVTRLAVALEPDRERVEQLVKVARQQPNRARRSAQQSRETSTVRKTTEDGSEVEDYVDAQEGHETQDGSSGSPNEQIPRSPSRPPQTFTRALAARDTSSRIFGRSSVYELRHDAG